MPTYEFRCGPCGGFDAVFPMATVPDQTACRRCGSQARRVPSAPWLGAGSSAAMALLDATARTASRPDVVEAVPGRRTPARPVSRNPLHARLPRSG